MGATPEQLATRVSTCGRGLGAFKFVAALAARTRPVQGQGAGGAGPGVADDLTRVMLTREQLAASLPALVLWTRAFPRLLGLPTLARLDAGLCARRTGSLEGLNVCKPVLFFSNEYFHSHHDTFPCTCELHRQDCVNTCRRKTISD